MTSRPLASMLPLVLLLAYGIGFASIAFGPGLVFDDHPGQLYRLAHVLAVGAAPWRWNPGLWAGYAELQFYPPGFSYLGAIVYRAGLGAVSIEQAYRGALWIAYLLPGVATQLLLARVLRNAWLALPWAFLALALSAGSRSGVEEGVRWGLVAARLGWGLLPLLALSLVRWVEGAPRISRATAPLLAAILLAHPTHAPAAICLLAVAVVTAPGPIVGRAGPAARALALGFGLAAFWLLPLLVHRHMALPLAWGDGSPAALGLSLWRHPLLVLLAAANAGALVAHRRLRAATPAAVWLTALAPAVGAVIAVDAAVLRPLGLLSLPPDRLMDSFLLSLVLGAAQALWLLPRMTVAGPWIAASLVALLAAVGMAGRGPEPTLTLLPDARQWPRHDEVARGLRLDDLWRALAQAPPGRILFMRSAVPLEYRPEWWRPHTHITALAPLRTGREILGGTFTHPSPMAGFFYTGSARYAPVTRLAEQLDGVSLFGRPLESISPEEFRRLAARLHVAAVVALDEDTGRLPFLAEPAFGPPRAIGPFRVFLARDPPTPLEATGPEARRLALARHGGGWVSTPLAYSPLWRARAAGAPLRTAPDDLGLLAVHVPAGDALTIALSHEPGWAEGTGVALSLASAAYLGAVSLRQRRRA